MIMIIRTRILGSVVFINLNKDRLYRIWMCLKDMLYCISVRMGIVYSK